MTRLALDPERGTSACVQYLPTRIRQAQGLELTRMKEGWTAGMMSPEQLRQLEQASDDTFAPPWLQLMVAHHQGPTTRAETTKRKRLLA